jgi:hypothetical protein
MAHWFVGGKKSMTRNSLLVATLLVATVSFSSLAEAQHGYGGRLHGSGNAVVNTNTEGIGNRLGWLSMASKGDYWAQNQSMQRPWHGEYYYLGTGQPTALVVPPTVVMQQNYSWGVSQNTMTPVYHQFSGHAPTGSGGGIFKATPVWPSHTNQFGVYPVRGPW